MLEGLRVPHTAGLFRDPGGSGLSDRQHHQLEFKKPNTSINVRNQRVVHLRDLPEVVSPAAKARLEGAFAQIGDRWRKPGRRKC